MKKDPPKLEFEPVDVLHSEVDTTLIDEMLRLSVEERLRTNDRLIGLALELRKAFETQRDGK